MGTDMPKNGTSAPPAVGALRPRAVALGYVIPPPTGLSTTHVMNHT